MLAPIPASMSPFFSEMTSLYELLIARSVPVFGCMVGDYTFCNIYSHIGDMLPTIQLLEYPILPPVRHAKGVTFFRLRFTANLERLNSNSRVAFDHLVSSRLHLIGPNGENWGFVGVFISFSYTFFHLFQV